MMGILGNTFMKKMMARLLFGGAAAIFGLGAAMHALAFRTHAISAIDQSRLPAFMGAELKVLWLADSSTLAMLALACGYLIFRPLSARGPVIFLLFAVPVATAALLYDFLGPFFAAHMLIAASLLVAVAGSMALKLQRTAGV